MLLPSSLPLASWPSLMDLLVARSPHSPRRVSSVGKGSAALDLFSSKPCPATARGSASQPHPEAVSQSQGRQIWKGSVPGPNLWSHWPLFWLSGLILPIPSVSLSLVLNCPPTPPLSWSLAFPALLCYLYYQLGLQGPTQAVPSLSGCSRAT